MKACPDSTQVNRSVVPLEQDAIVGQRYQLLRLTWGTGETELWEAVDLVLGRPVAVQVLRPDLASVQADVERFQAEALKAARLDHPHIISVFDACVGECAVAVVSQLVRGSSLREVLHEEGPLPVERVIGIGVQVADALDHAHGRGVEHGDLKTDDIVLCADGRVMVSGFGRGASSRSASDCTGLLPDASALREEVPASSTDVVLFVAPDVCALAIVLRQALHGGPAPESDRDAPARRSGSTEPHRRLEAEGAAQLEELLADVSTELRGDHRYRTAGAFRNALLEASPVLDLDLTEPTPLRSVRARPDRDRLADDTPSAGVDVRTSKGRRRARRRLGISVVAVTALLAGGALGIEVRTNLFDGRDGDVAPVMPEVAPVVPPAEAVPASAAPFDPRPGDGHEGDASLVHLTDGNPQTIWHSERYDTRAFGNLKAGVGFILSLDEPAALTRLEVDAATVGWGAELYVADEVHGELAGWGPPVAVVAGIQGNHVFALGGVKAKHVLVWFSDLGDGSIGKPHQMQVGSVRVFR